MKNKIIFSLAFIIFGVPLFSQPFQLDKKGMIVFNKPSFKHFAILMQDTTLSGNRFDNWFDMPRNKYFTTNPKKTVQYPAFIVDSALFFRCEEKLLNPDSAVKFYSYPKYPSNNDKLKKNVKKYIRLYIGYIDGSGDKKVVVQFIKPKEFKKMEHIYSKELFLIANQKKLRFAIIQLQKPLLSVECSKNESAAVRVSATTDK